MLSRSARTLWAKTGVREASNLWGALTVHLADSAEVARLLWREWLPRSTRSFICEHTNLRSEQAEAMLVCLAGVHDIGKATPSFQSKVPERLEHVRESGLDIGYRTEAFSHAFLSEAILNSWLVKRGVDKDNAECLSVIVGGHHGSYSTEEDLRRIDSRQRINARGCLGDEAWASVQDELMGWVSEHSGATRQESCFVSCLVPPAVQVLLTGLTIVADWIASNTDLFPLEPRCLEWRESAMRAESAWDSLHLPEPFDFSVPQEDDDALLHDRFPSVPVGAGLRPAQRAVIETARDMVEPGLVVVEDQMGGGKTEAALLAAEILAARFGCGGVAFLLPTQATSNAMFVRVESWLRSILEAGEAEHPQDIHLLHGKSALNDDFASLPVWKPTWLGDSPSIDELIVVNQWFGGAKRGLLAPFVVGTVDQLLMAALKARHVQLRLLGLAGKVVIIDEVHAYDAYMSEYLKCVLRFLGCYGVPVVLLSATLPSTRREELLKAYRGELRAGRRRRPTPARQITTDDGHIAYPLVSRTPGNKLVPPTHMPVRSAFERKVVGIRALQDDIEVLVNELREALREGGCVCVIRDTVRRAQETYNVLKKQLDVEVVLVHSRFIALDRSRNDARIAKLLGPSEGNRPEALVVVGTQVIEQSLDVDFDLMISDVAPVDLIIQRIGRLHRHKRGEGECQRPPTLRKPQFILTGFSQKRGEAPAFARGIGAVYQAAILLRTLAALDLSLNKEISVSLPEEIASLVECVYEESVEIPEAWHDSYENAREQEREELLRKQQSAKQWLLGNMPRYNLQGWMRSKVNVRDEMIGGAAVRDTEESIEVVIVCSARDGYTLLPWIVEQLGVNPHLGAGYDEPTDAQARAASLCSVCLPPAMSAPYVIEDVIEALETQGDFSGWQKSRWLHGILPLVIDERGEATLECGTRTFLVRYTRACGLELLQSNSKAERRSE